MKTWFFGGTVLAMGVLVAASIATPAGAQGKEPTAPAAKPAAPAAAKPAKISSGKLDMNEDVQASQEQGG